MVREGGVVGVIGLVCLLRFVMMLRISDILERISSAFSPLLVEIMNSLNCSVTS